jgi:CO/xanthine dehydrogenase FAD-binding subunit
LLVVSERKDGVQVPAPFEYERATSVDHALKLLRMLGPEARILAGGHSLLPMMKLRLASPAYLIDIDCLAGELGYIRQHEDEVRVGAMTRHRELLESELLHEKVSRRVGDWAVAAAAASVTLSDGRIEHAGIALAAVGAGVRASEAEAELLGKTPSEELFADAGRLVADASAPIGDQRGSAEYKRHVAGVLTERVLRRAVARALREAA